MRSYGALHFQWFILCGSRPTMRCAARIGGDRKGVRGGRWREGKRTDGTHLYAHRGSLLGNDWIHHSRLSRSVRYQRDNARYNVRAKLLASDPPPPPSPSSPFPSCHTWYSSMIFRVAVVHRGKTPSIILSWSCEDAYSSSVSQDTFLIETMNSINNSKLI